MEPKKIGDFRANLNTINSYKSAVDIFRQISQTKRATFLFQHLVTLQVDQPQKQEAGEYPFCLAACPNFYQYCRKSSQITFYMKFVLFEIANKLPEYLGYFCKNICYQEVLKIAQSSHTAGLLHFYVPIPTSIKIFFS